jgi:hypothetical protein
VAPGATTILVNSLDCGTWKVKLSMFPSLWKLCAYSVTPFAALMPLRVSAHASSESVSCLYEIGSLRDLSPSVIPIS